MAPSGPTATTRRPPTRFSRSNSGVPGTELIPARPEASIGELSPCEARLLEGREPLLGRASNEIRSRWRPSSDATSKLPANAGKRPPRYNATDEGVVDAGSAYVPR